MSTQYRAKTSYRDSSGYDEHRRTSFRHRLIRRKEDGALAEYLAQLGTEDMLLLDVACGTGNALRVAQGMGAAAVGLDISFDMLRAARERLRAEGGNPGLVLADAEHFPFLDGAFECVTASRFIAHLPGPVCETVMRELARVTRDAVVLTHNHSICLEYVVRRLLGLFKHGKREKHSRRSLTRAQMSAQLRSAGLRLEVVRFVAPLWQEECILLARKMGPGSEQNAAE